MAKHAPEKKPKTILYAVTCPSDGVQFLRPTGLHLFVRAKQQENVVTFFCPVCNEQRWQLIGRTLSNDLIESAAVQWTLLHIPPEALEAHFTAPLTEAWISSCLQEMKRANWPSM